MVKTLLRSVREYKSSSLLAPVFIMAEVIVECIIPFITAKLVNNIQSGCDMNTIVKYGLLLVLMAVISLVCGALAGHFARAYLFRGGGNHEGAFDRGNAPNPLGQRAPIPFPSPYGERSRTDRWRCRTAPGRDFACAQRRSVS